MTTYQTPTTIPLDLQALHAQVLVKTATGRIVTLGQVTGPHTFTASVGAGDHVELAIPSGSFPIEVTTQ